MPDGAITGQVRDAVGVLHHPLQPVLGQQHGHTQVVHQAGDRGQHLLGSGRVERRGRLVQHQDARVRGEYRADRHPLLLAAGQLVQRPVPQLGQAQQVEGLLHPLAHHLRRDGQLLHRVGEFLLHRVGGEPGQRVLPHHAHHVGEFARRMVRGVPPVDRHPAVQGTAGEVRHQAVHGAQERRLAGAGPAHHQAQLTFRDRQFDDPQDRLGRAVVHHGDLVETDHSDTSESSRSGVVRGDGSAEATGGRPGGGASTPAAPASSRASAGTSGREGQLSGYSEGLSAVAS